MDKFEYTDTEFRFIEWYKKYKTLPLDSQMIEFLYPQVLDYKVSNNKALMNDNSPNREIEILKYKYEILQETITWLKKTLSDEIKKCEKKADYSRKNHLNSEYLSIIRVLKQAKDEMEEELDKTDALIPASSGIEKLKWIGTPSQFGYILGELAEKGYIELPKTKGKESYSKYAKICLSLFEINTPKGPTTKGTLENELNLERNSLSATNRNFFKIPNQADL